MTDLPSSQIPPTALIRSQNIDYAPGFLQKAPGAYRYNNVALTGGLVALTDYWYTYIQQRMLVATADGKLWKDYGDKTFSFNVPITTGLGTLDNRSQFVIAGQESAGNPKKVFFFSGGKAQVRVITGDNNFSTLIAEPSVDWANPNISGDNLNSNFPLFGLLHRGRLWCFAKSIGYASNTTDHEDFQTTSSFLSITAGQGEGGNIVGGFVYKNTLFVFKQGDFVYRLVDTDPDASNWYFTKLSSGFGIASQNSVAQMNDNLVVGNVTGSLTNYSATFYDSNFSQADMFKTARVNQFYRQNTTPAGTPFMQALYYEDKGHGFFTTKQSYLTYNDSMVHISLSDPQVPKWGFWTHLQADCLASRRDINNILKPIYGGTDGFVYFADSETRTVNGAGYQALFQTPYLDFRHLDPSFAMKQKEFERLAVTFTPDGLQNLSIDVWIDGKFSQTVTCAQTIDTNYLDSFVLDQSILGSPDEQTILIDLRGAGRRISLVCYNSVAYQNFKVSQLAIGFRILGEDATVTL
jgi:hypothetical protein